jgi:hypothetical protein
VDARLGKGASTAGFRALEAEPNRLRLMTAVPPSITSIRDLVSGVFPDPDEADGPVQGLI